MSAYTEILMAVESYYGVGSDQWLQIAQYGTGSPEAVEIIKQVPGVTAHVNPSGQILDWTYSNPFKSAVNPAEIIDSNVPSSMYGGQSFVSEVPGTVVETQTVPPKTVISSGAKTVSSGATVASVMDKVSLALAGVALGTKLGKLIDGGLYALNPRWWDEHYPTINPETWDQLTSNEIGQRVIRSIFGLHDDETTMYLDEELLAYTYMCLLANGGYDTEYETDQSKVPSGMLHYPDANYTINTGTTLDSLTIRGSHEWRRKWGFSSGSGLIVAWAGENPIGGASIYFCSTEPGGVGYADENGSIQYRNLTNSFTRGGHTIYYGISQLGCSDTTETTLYSFQRSYVDNEQDFATIQDALVIALFGSEKTSSLDGVKDNPASQIYIDPNLITGQTLPEILAQLKQYYPDLFNDSVYMDILQDDGTTTRKQYVPVPYPDIQNPTQPTTPTIPGVDPQTQPEVKPGKQGQEVIDDIVDKIKKPANPPEKGEGETPTVTTPTGSASALYSVYNPTQAELNSFGAWLWSSAFVDQLLKLFNDPMQAIIGLHKVFATPITGGTGNIKVGYLDSGVSSKLVTSQYVDIDCGSVSVREYFGNVFDYDPFTNIYIYLPFIGIQRLDTGDVMRSTIKVIYHVDVITGACLAEVRVTRDTAGGVLYQYAGNCAVQYPISSGSYMGIVASVTSIAGGIAGTIATGGALAPMAIGAVGGAMNAHTRVEHSGGFSGNAGAMGGKKPYLIITRPQPHMALNVEDFKGKPANYTTVVGACSGFIKCLECHVNNIFGATDEELNEIESLLKSGVII